MNSMRPFSAWRRKTCPCLTTSASNKPSCPMRIRSSPRCRSCSRPNEVASRASQSEASRAMPEIQMPKLSDTMTEGTLVSWKKKIGDQVTAGEILAEIETDKATMEWEATDDGVLKEIYVPEGGKVNVGDRIAFIAGEGAEIGRGSSRE